MAPSAHLRRRDPGTGILRQFVREMHCDTREYTVEIKRLLEI